MLSDSIREARQRALSNAHGGRVVISSEERLAEAAILAAWETEARNLEAAVEQARRDRTALAGVFRGEARLKSFGRRGGGRT